MKPEIKQRIEQLNNGKIPKGYQKTDFGVFPSDWVTDKSLSTLELLEKEKAYPATKCNPMVSLVLDMAIFI